MHVSIERSAAMRHSSKQRLATAVAAVALVATGAASVMGGDLFASEEGGATPPPQGEQVNDIPTGVEFSTPASGENDLIVTSGSNFDETTLTKYIPAANFQVLQGASAVDKDTIGEVFTDTCVSPGSDSAGTLTELSAPVELPDGARIKRIHFYGVDDDAADINVYLRRVQFETELALGPGTPATDRSRETVTSFATSGTDTDGVVFSSTDDLAEITGSFSTGAGPALTGFANRFHNIKVELSNGAGSDHQLCGARVDYQVPASTVDPGTVFHPIDPIRVYDSRIGSFPDSGLLDPETSRVIDITDGYDLDGAAIPAQADSVPSDATAIAYSITVSGQTGPNFTSVTAGDAAVFTTSAINFGPAGDAANGSTVTVSNGQIKLWGGDGAGSVHVIIDVAGYYAPPQPPPNMGN